MREETTYEITQKIKSSRKKKIKERKIKIEGPGVIFLHKRLVERKVVKTVGGTLTLCREGRQTKRGTGECRNGERGLTKGEGQGNWDPKSSGGRG